MDPFVLLALALSALIILITIIVAYVFVKKLNEEKESPRHYRKLEREKEKLEELLKNLKIEYYKRHLSEQEFKSECLKVQNELKSLEKKLERAEEAEKESAWEKRKRKKFIRNVERTLRRKTKNYSRKEMRQILKEQNYSGKEIERILKEIFGK